MSFGGRGRLVSRLGGIDEADGPSRCTVHPDPERDIEAPAASAVAALRKLLARLASKAAHAGVERMRWTLPKVREDDESAGAPPKLEPKLIGEAPIGDGLVREAGLVSDGGSQSAGS